MLPCFAREVGPPTTAVDTLLNDNQQEVCHAVGLTRICTLVVQLRLFMTTVVVTSCV